MADRIRSIAQDHYPHIGRVADVRPIHAGNISRTFVITTVASDAYVLKVKSGRLFDRQTTLDMHHYLAYLQAQALPVPRIIATADRVSVAQDGTSLYELQAYIAHDGNLDDCEYADVSDQVFGLLGRYHHLSRTYPHAFGKVAYLGDSRLPIGLDARYFGGALDYAIPRGIQSAAAEPRHGKALRAALDDFEGTLRAIRADVARHLDALAQVINHNDIYGNNLLFRDGRLVGLVDFDFCMTDVYYLDLVEALHYSALLRTSDARYFGLPADGTIRTRHGIDDLRLYLAHNPDFAYDGRLLVQLLMAKVMSLALFPPLELYEDAGERLEMYRRVKRTVENLRDLGAFAL